MSNQVDLHLEFSSPCLERAGKELEKYGYELVATNRGYNQVGNLITAKVYQCNRNNVQVTLQTEKMVSQVDLEQDTKQEIKVNE
jgi:hypothetical protein